MTGAGQQGLTDTAGRPEEAQMRFYRMTFLGGLAIGYVLGTQAGRERYEQLKQLARKAAESPGIQQTAGALQAQAMATAKTARDKAATSMRKGASNVAKRVPSAARPGDDEVPGSGSTAANGAMPQASGRDDQTPFRSG